MNNSKKKSSSKSGVWDIKPIEAKRAIEKEIENVSASSDSTVIDSPHLLKQLTKYKKKVNKYKAKVEQLKSYKTLYEALQKQDQVEKTALGVAGEKEGEDGDASNADFLMPIQELLTNLVCSICAEYFVQPTGISCEHIFCHHCIKSWLSEHHRCPACRTPVPSYENIMPNKFFGQLVNHFLSQHLSTAKLNEHRALITERGPAVRDAALRLTPFDDFARGNQSGVFRLMSMVAHRERTREMILSARNASLAAP